MVVMVWMEKIVHYVLGCIISNTFFKSICHVAKSIQLLTVSECLEYFGNQWQFIGASYACILHYVSMAFPVKNGLPRSDRSS